MVEDPRGRLVETCVQILSILLDYTPPGDLVQKQKHRQVSATASQSKEGGAAVEGSMANLFCSFMSRLQLSEVRDRGCVCQQENSVVFLSMKD